MEKIIKRQDGITLVALIITIIVMMILAGVIITAAVADGGIIDRAKISMIEKERAEIEEIIIASYFIKEFASSTNTYAYLDLGKTADAIYENLTLNGFTVTNAVGGKIPVNTDSVTGEETGFDLNVKGDHGEYEGEVGTSGIVGEIEVVTPETPEEEKNNLPTLPEGLTVGSEFEMDANEDGEVETWIVLYDGTASHLNENEIEIISKDTMGENLTLGKSDTEAMSKATDLDGNKKVEDLEIAIYSYNNAIDRINNYCDSLIKIDNLGVRSVGSKPSDPSYRNTSKPYPIENLDKWTDKRMWNTYGILGENADTNYNEDINKMNTLGICKSGDAKGYWLASRYVSEFWQTSATARMSFCVWIVSEYRI